MEHKLMMERVRFIVCDIYKDRHSVMTMNICRYLYCDDPIIWYWMTYWINMELGNCSLEGEDRDIWRDRVICSEVK